MNTIISIICLVVIVEICWTLGSSLRALVEGEPKKSMLPGVFFILGIITVTVLGNTYL